MFLPSDGQSELRQIAVQLLLSRTYPMVIYRIDIEHGPVEIVGLPIQNGEFPEFSH